MEYDGKRISMTVIQITYVAWKQPNDELQQSNRTRVKWRITGLCRKRRVVKGVTWASERNGLGRRRTVL